MRFLFKYPTRGRPDLFKSTLTKWIDMLSGKHSYQFLVTVDNDDWSMETPEMGIFLDNARYTDAYYAEPTTKVDAINRDIDMAQPFDIIVLISDDMIPEIVGYDDEIAHDMEKYFPMFDGALHYNDGSTTDKLITLSIMGVRLYEYFGYIYNPEYNSLWCDNEFTDVVQNMKKCVYSPRTIIRHKWQHHGNDETYKKSEAAYQADNRTYTRRKEAGFPIPKKVEKPMEMKNAVKERLDLFSQHALNGKSSAYNSYLLAEKCILDNIEGDFVECGVFCGTQIAAMALANQIYNGGRNIHLFDSFEGIPRAGPNDTLSITDCIGKGNGQLVATGVGVQSIEAVIGHMESWGIDPEQLVYHKGWFQHTVPKTEIEKIAILRLDGDLYESTKVCLEGLHPFVQKGGYVIVDDYNLEGCRKALDEYLDKIGYKPEITVVENAGGAVYYKVE